MRVFIILLILSQLSGCVGFAVGTYGTFEYRSENFILEEQPNQLGFGASKESYSQEKIIAAWGKPDVQYTENKCSVLSYYNGYNWSGFGAFAVIFPIPFVIPSSRNETRFYFIDNKSVAVITEGGKITSMLGYICSSHLCGFQAGPINANIPRKVTIDQCN